MSGFEAKQYLEAAINYAGRAVLMAAHSDVHWVKGRCFLRAIFPCIFVQENKYRFDLPDCARCNFKFAIVEREIFSKKEKSITKLKEDLSESTTLQANVGASLLKEILPWSELAQKEILSLREIISPDRSSKKNRLSIGETIDIRVVEFSCSRNRASLITPAASKFACPAKRFMRKRCKEVHQLYFKEFFQQSWQQEKDLPDVQRKNNLRMLDNMKARYWAAPDLSHVGKNGYRFVNAISDFATHADPIRRTKNYEENLFLRTVEGNPMIDRAYKMALAAA